jgi:hypothetical protein
MDKVEYEQRYYGRIYGKRRAKVCANQDPQRRGRVRVKNMELYGTSESPWAMPCYPFYGGRDCGFFAVPPIGSLVWIECEEGLPAYPVYTGGYFDLSDTGHQSDGSTFEQSSEFQTEPSMVPSHGRGHYDGSDYGGGIKGRYGVPSSSFEGEYGEVTILQTKTGHRLEFDDTLGGERIQIHHSKGAHIEILPDGSINIVTEAKVLTRSSYREEVVTNNRIETVGSHTETVEGDYESQILGSEFRAISGGLTSSSKSLSANIDGLLKMDSGSLKATVANLLEVSSGSDASVTCFGDFDLTSAGKGFMSFSNAVSIPALLYTEDSLTIQGLNGNITLSSADFAGLLRYGVSMRGGLPALTGGQVFLGNLSNSVLGVGGVPLLKEPAVMGTQMQLFMEAVLGALDGFFLATNTGGVTPGFGGPNPILGAASIAAQLALNGARTTFLTPTPNQPLILSECVYLSKA